MKRSLAAFVVCAVVVLPQPTPAAELPADAVGEVKELDAGALFRRATGEIAAERGGAVFSGDTVVTDASGAIGITFVDGTVLSLGPDSELVIDDMVYDPQADNLAFSMQVLQGTVGYLSGRIAALNPENVLITTPNSTIGIRGTRILIRVAD